MVYMHNGILFSLKKEWDFDAYYDMNEPWNTFFNFKILFSTI